MKKSLRRPPWRVIWFLFAAVVLSAQGHDRDPLDFDYFDSRLQSTKPTTPLIRRHSSTPIVHSDILGDADRPSVTFPEALRAALETDHRFTGPASMGYEFRARRASGSARTPLQSFWLRTFSHGIPVFGGEFAVHLDPAGQLVAASVPSLPSRAGEPRPNLSAVEALRGVVAHVAAGEGVDTASDGAVVQSETVALLAVTWSDEPIEAHLVWFPSAGELKLGWRAFVDIPGTGLFELVVGADDGAILFSQNLVRHEVARGRVFRAPDVPSPERGGPTVESLQGWISGPTLVGNNASACVDPSGRDFCQPGPSMPDLDFSFPFADSYARTGNAAADENAAMTNAFYWVNVVHDWLYELGFDEAAGNFQLDNGNLGGIGGDAVRIDVHDGAVTGDANFSTPPDGQRPRMQLGLFPDPRRDAAFDGDTIIHEYVHGLTARLVGGPTNTSILPRWQSGAMGEGWSDALAASFTDDPVISEYVTQNFETGIRSAAYDRSPYTFGQFGTLYQTRIDELDWTGGLPQVHQDGEIWATVLWDVRQAVGKSVFEQAVVAGLSMTPARPSMLDARDAMLTASDALFGSHVSCAMWGAFAKRGLGASAALNPIQDNAPRDTALSVFEAFDLPASCGGAAKLEAGTLFRGDGAAGGWHMTGLWHVSSRRIAEGSAAYWFGSEASGGYGTGAHERGALTSPEIDLTGVEEPVLEWSQYLDGEGFGRSYRIWSGPSAPYLNYDAGRLLISLDGGSNWSTLTHLAHNTAGAEFDRYRINLSRFAGQRIRLRFVFDTLDEISNGHEGWFIDDVRILKLVNGQRLDRSTIRLRLPGTDQSRPGARRPPMR